MNLIDSALVYILYNIINYIFRKNAENIKIFAFCFHNPKVIAIPLYGLKM